MGFLAFMWKSLFRRKVRTALTIASLVSAFSLFVLLRSVSVVFELDLEMGGADRLNTSSKFSIIDSIPLSHERRIRAIKGVREVTHMVWFGGAYQDPNTFLMTFAVDPESYFDVYRELDLTPDQLEAFISNKGSMVVPRAMAEEHGWAIGDRVPLLSQIYAHRDGTMGWDFELAGIFDSDAPFSTAALIQYSYFNAAKQWGETSLVDWFTISVKDPLRAPEIASEIDALFQNSSDPTRTGTEADTARDWMAQIGDISLMLTGILSAVFFTMLLLAGNTMMQGLRERIPELGVMKTLGFSDMRIFLLVLGESLILCFFSAGIGIALGAAVVQFVAEAIGEQLPILLTLDTLLVAAAVAAGFTVLVGAVPSASAARLKIVDALRVG